jgi:uncharacterized glyoxalase superfamily protein PhnB
MSETPTLNQLNLMVGDMAATVAFYRKLGLALDAPADAQHVEFRFPSGMVIEFDTADSVRTWDSCPRTASGGGTVIGFSVKSRQAVDTLYDDLTGAGGCEHQVPYDAFWGARYAIVDDPDGHPVGIMGPIEADRKTWPPSPPPVRR